MPDAKYAFTTAYLKGQEAKAVTSEHFNRLSKVAGIQDALLAIRDTSVGAYLEGLNVTSFDELDANLWKYFGESIRYLEWFRLLPGDIRKLVKAYTIKYDVANIKVALLSTSTGKKASLIPVGVIYECGSLDELAAARDIESIVRVLNACKLSDYTGVVEGYQAGGDNKARLVTEARLDNLFYTNLKKTVRKLGDGSTLGKAVGTMIDITNLQTIMRVIIEGTTAQATDYLIKGGYFISNEVVKELLGLKLNELPARLSGSSYSDAVQEIIAEYEKTNNVSIIEEVMGRHGFRLAREMLSLKLLSTVTALWYLVLKEAEIRGLRLALKAIFDKVPLDEIRKLVVFAA